MKQIRNRNFQQVQNFNPWAGVKDLEPQKEEDIIWLTPDEFKEEVCRLLKEKFDEREKRKVQ